MTAVIVESVTVESITNAPRVVCGCGDPARWLSTVRPCNHQFPLCDHHAEIGNRFWAETRTGAAIDPKCAQCDKPATAREIRPI